MFEYSNNDRWTILNRIDVGDFVFNTVIRDFEHQSWNIWNGPTLSHIDYIELYELNFNTILLIKLV